MVQIGDVVANFKLFDGHKKEHQLSDYKGQVVVIYIYPKNNTPGCSAEACSFNNAIAEYRQKGIVLLGMSKDSVESHHAFLERFNLSFPTLSDPTMATIKYFGAASPKIMFGRTFLGVKRNTYVINKEGILVAKMLKVSPKENAQDVLKVIDDLGLLK